MQSVWAVLQCCVCVVRSSSSRAAVAAAAAAHSAPAAAPHSTDTGADSTDRRRLADRVLHSKGSLLEWGVRIVALLFAYLLVRVAAVYRYLLRCHP